MNSISLYGVNSIDLYQLLRLRHPRRNLAVGCRTGCHRRGHSKSRPRGPKGFPWHTGREPGSLAGKIVGPINLLVRMVVRSAIPRRCSIEIHAS